MKKSRILTENKYSFRITDILYLAGIAALVAACYRLFYRMAIEYQGRYISDVVYYVNLPTAANKERYRIIGFVFDLLYRLGIRSRGMAAYLALTIGLIVLANFIYLKFFREDDREDRIILQAASLLMPFMGPIYFPGFHEYYYEKSFQTFAWHSPTEQSMILFSIFAMMCFIKMYEESGEKVSVKWWLLTMITSLLSALGKPAFAIDLILAMILMFLIDLFNDDGNPFLKRLGNRIIMGISLIPTGLYMLLEMKLDFEGQGESHSGSVVMSMKSVIEYDGLFAAIVCGLAFPIIVWAVNFRRIKEKRYKTVFMVFLMGIAQWAFLAEEGPRAGHGNFTWGRQAGCYFLFLTSVAMAVNNWYDKDFMAGRPVARKTYFAGLVMLLALHICSQLRYFYIISQGHIYYF